MEEKDKNMEEKDKNMEEKDKNTILILVFIILLFVGIGCGWYLGVTFANKEENTNKEIVNDNNENNTQTNEVEDNNEEQQVIDNAQTSEIENSSVSQDNDGKNAWYYEVNDEYANIANFFLSNGTLYYHKNIGEANENSGGAFKYIITSTVDGVNYNDVKKYNGLSNISKIRIKNSGTGVNPVLFVITEDGKLYISYMYELFENSLKFELFSDKYDIEDVLDWPEMGDLKVLLKDGSTKAIKQN